MSQREDQREDKFRWPPRDASADMPSARAGAEQTPVPGQALARRRVGSSRVVVAELGFWKRLERDWLGLRAGAWRERAMVAGFEVDAIYDYCGGCGVSKEAGKACVVCVG